MTKKQTSIITALSVLAVLLALLVSARLWFRLDLTAQHAYTISPVSRNLAKEINEPVQITYYVSSKLEKLYPQPNAIKDLIREYTTYSKGKIRFTVRDPAKEGLEQLMQNLGIQPTNIQVVEKDEASFSLVYTGIRIEYLDRQDVIPLIFSTSTLEYDLTSRIRSLVNNTEKQIGIIVASVDRNFQQNFNMLNQYLEFTGFKVRQIAPGEEIDRNLPGIIVIGGTETLDDWALYQIDLYLQFGGRAMFLADSVAVDLDNNGPQARQLEDQGLLAMLENYGAKIDNSLVLDISSLSVPANGLMFIRYPFWVSVLQDNANVEHPVTAQFGGVSLFWPNPIELLPRDGTEAAALFTSTDDSWLQTKNFVLDINQIQLMQQEQESTSGKKILSAALSGKFPSFFQSNSNPQGWPKPEREGSEIQLPDMPLQNEESRIIVVGNINFIDDRFQQERDERNISFFISAADWLSNDADIIGIRSRASGGKGLNRIADPDARFAASSFARALNTVLIPLAVLVLGIYAGVRRKKRIESTSKETEDAI
ncbi:MAG: GldG family protein [Spirochaetaceae bacterium]|jgi:gliding-associated putative ABC transporter substrate-binding component GldG|nr:GldG family protein [Spirochaetaceae bacterium]